MAGVGKPFENAVILVAVGVVAIIINTMVSGLIAFTLAMHPDKIPR